MSGFRQFFRLLGLTLFQSRGTFARPTLKRAGILSIVVPLLLIPQLCHWLGFILDEIFFRGYRAVKVRGPVLIVGVPRSGTTLLHRMLARDTENFTTMKLWEMLLAPSITERKLLLALRSIDRRFGGLGRRLLAAIDARAFACLRSIHKISLFEPEEDDLVLLPIFSSVFLLVLFPFPRALWHLVRFDRGASAADKRRIMSFYRRCVQRHLYVNGPDKCFLSKNPSYTARIDAINEYFPDVKIVYSVREPLSTIPSLMSYLSFPWDWVDNDPRAYLFRDGVLDMAEHWYRHPMERLADWPDSRSAVVRYDALMADPRAVAGDLYARLGLDISPAFAECLREEYARSRTYRSEHNYSLSQYGLTPQDILDRFGDIVEYCRSDVSRVEEHTVVPLSAVQRA